MVLAIAIPLALAAGGTAAAVSATNTNEMGPIKILPSPSPSPTLTTSLSKLTNPVRKLLSSGGSGTPSGGTSPAGSGTTGSNSPSGGAASPASTAGSPAAPGLAWSWTVPYGGWVRFFDRADTPFSSSGVSYVTQPFPAPAAPKARTATLASASTPILGSPAYLWLLLPIGFLVLLAAGFAVFEPTHASGRVGTVVRSIHRTSKEMPAGMARSTARTAVRLIRGFGRWERR